jgi:hypothetical protein
VNIEQTYHSGNLSTWNDFVFGIAPMVAPIGMDWENRSYWDLDKSQYTRRELTNVNKRGDFGINTFPFSGANPSGAFWGWDFINVWGRHPDINGGLPHLRGFDGHLPLLTPIESISWWEDSRTIDAGQSYSLQVSYQPWDANDFELKVEWTNSNPSVARVCTEREEGQWDDPLSATVHALHNGTTTITATMDGRTLTHVLTVVNGTDVPSPTPSPTPSPSPSPIPTSAPSAPSGGGGGSSQPTPEPTPMPTTSPEPRESLKFADVSADQWFHTPITYLANLGIAKGDYDGNFNPDNEISRADFLILLMRAFEIELTDTDGFYDTQNSYFSQYIATAKNLGKVRGIGDNLFLPYENIERGHAFLMSKNFSGLDLDNDGRPTDNLTRAEGATIIYRLITTMQPRHPS